MHGTFHRSSVQPAMHRAPALRTLDQICASQHIEMLHDGRQRHRKRRGKLRHCQIRLPSQAIDDGAPGGIGERGEGEVQLGIRIVNHMVKYCGTGGDVNPLADQGSLNKTMQRSRRLRS